MVQNKKINMKNCFLMLAFVALYYSSHSQSKAEKTVQQKILQLKLAMINADSVMLDKLTDASLSYGHSGGTVEGKDAFIKKIISGKSDFVSIDISDQTILMSGKTAVVRYLMNAKTNDNGSPGEVHLRVLLIWQKTRGAWKLLARQAIKFT